MVDYKEVLDSGLMFHAQPIVRLHDKLVVGYELLARLKVGDRLIPPHEFIADIEQKGLYGVLDNKLSEYVINYINNTKDLFVSINVPSIESLEFHASNEFFVKHASRIHLELLESVEWSSPDNLAAVEKASSEGFHIMLDDFGSGLSNFKTLLSPAIDGVKFDKGMLETFMNEKNFEVLERLVDMVYVLKKQVVFEGIESPNHERFIERLNQDALCQGYLYGRPDLMGYE